MVIGEGSTYRLHRVGMNGDTTMTIEVQRDPVPVTAAERDSALATFSRRIVEIAGGATPDREPTVAGTKPAHGALHVDDRGHVWVRRVVESEVGSAWDVIDPDGRLLGSVAIPLPASRPVVRGDRLAIVTEVDDAPTVVVYDLVRGGP
jgi:sugar lactone lactonase YvrE